VGERGRMRGKQKVVRNLPARVNCPGNHGVFFFLICESTIPPMMDAPRTPTPVAIPSFFIILLLRNFALSGGVTGVSGGGEEGMDDGPSEIDDDDEWCEGENLSGDSPVPAGE
jgi:hypothetical protein